MASSFFAPEVSSPKEALYITEERLSDIHRSGEKLWHAAEISSNEKLRKFPEGGRGNGPELLTGAPEIPVLKLPMVLRAAEL